MNIAKVAPLAEGLLRVVADDGRAGALHIHPYLESAAFRPLKDPDEFAEVRSGGYYVEWACGADLSADTIEVHWVLDASHGATERAGARPR